MLFQRLESHPGSSPHSAQGRADPGLNKPLKETLHKTNAVRISKPRSVIWGGNLREGVGSGLLGELIRCPPDPLLLSLWGSGWDKVTEENKQKKGGDKGQGGMQGMRSSYSKVTCSQGLCPVGLTSCVIQWWAEKACGKATMETAILFRTLASFLTLLRTTAFSTF